MDNATITTVAERVAAGVAWLYEQVPDWRAKVDSDSLDIDDASMCVLGQVFRDAGHLVGYDGYERAVGLAVPPTPLEDGSPFYGYDRDRTNAQTAWATAHGFIDDGMGRTCDCDDCLDNGETSLTEQWREELAL